MTDPLRSEILVPASPFARTTLVLPLVALGCSAIAAAIGFTAAPAPSTTVAVIPIPQADVELAPVPAHTVAHEIAQPVQPPELSLVFSAGRATYMKLADIGEGGESMPSHGTPKLYSHDYVETAVASVDDSAVPHAYRDWQGKSVTVDNACTTKVTGFAVVARLTGDTGYASGDLDKWTAANVLDHGSVVLAAKLAGCTGTFARDAALPAVIVPAEIKDAKLAAQARARVIDSTPARDTQHEYAEFDQTGNWWESEHAKFATKIVRHPTTGVTWVSVHASMEHGCGDPEVNVWGLFRVQADGSLATVQLRRLDDLWSIDQLIDIDNDGELEVIGTPWLGLDTVVARGSGEELDRLALSFFGCPC